MGKRTAFNNEENQYRMVGSKNPLHEKKKQINGEN